MAAPCLKFLPEEHTDFVFSVRVERKATLLLLAAAAAEVVGILPMRRR